VLLPEVDVAAVPVAVLLEPLLLLPSPSALRAANNECKKLCTDCDDALLDAALLEALLVVPATALFVAAAAEVAAVAAALLVADVDEMDGMPTTCSNDCNKLLNNP
jgi:hypothetical protein